jgi:hypothetical protein
MAEQSTPPRKTKIGSTYVLTLPISGEKVRVRRPSTFSLVAAGALPAELTTLVWKLFGDRKKSMADVMMDAEQLSTYTQLVERFVPHVLVSPKIGDTTELEHDKDGVLTGMVALVDLADLDKNNLFMFGIGAVHADEEVAEVVAADLATFRAKQPRTDAGPGGKAVRPAAKPVSGPSSEQPTGD